MIGLAAGDGEDLPEGPIEARKDRLAQLLGRGAFGVRSTSTSRRGALVFQHACALGCEGIVCKRKGSRYPAGRTPHWLKFKNPAAPAATRDAEEDWGKRRARR